MPGTGKHTIPRDDCTWDIEDQQIRFLRAAVLRPSVLCFTLLKHKIDTVSDRQAQTRIREWKTGRWRWPCS